MHAFAPLTAPYTRALHTRTTCAARSTMFDWAAGLPPPPSPHAKCHAPQHRRLPHYQTPDLQVRLRLVRPRTSLRRRARPRLLPTAPTRPSSRATSSSSSPRLLPPAPTSAAGTPSAPSLPCSSERQVEQPTVQTGNWAVRRSVGELRCSLGVVVLDEPRNSVSSWQGQPGRTWWRAQQGLHWVVKVGRTCMS